MQVKIADSWKNILQNEFEKAYFKDSVHKHGANGEHK